MILALNGGGIRGALQAGALLEVPGVLLDTFKDGVYGVSVGAIIATYIAFGFSATDLSKIFTEWSDVPLNPPSIDAFTKMYTSQGLDDGSIIRERMVKNFLKKGLDFNMLRIRDALVPLHIVATDFTNVRVVVFGRSMHVWDAVRASISLPMVFTPHVLTGTMFVDGGVMCTDISKCIPIQDRKNTFFLLTTRSIPPKMEHYLDAVTSCASTRGAHDIKLLYPDRTCLIVDDDTPTLDMWSSTESIQIIVERGRAAMKAFVQVQEDDFLGPNADIKNCS
jgi:Patatin-like phospholipase